MLDSDLASAIETAVKSTLAPIHVLSVGVIEGEDYDDNDVLFVTINLSAEAGRIPGEQMLKAMSAVSETLLKSGDQREPYFKSVREGELAALDEEAGAQS